MLGFKGVLENAGVLDVGLGKGSPGSGEAAVGWKEGLAVLLEYTFGERGSD